MLALIFALAAALQDPAVDISYESLPAIEASAIERLAASSHPDPDSLPADAVLEVMGVLESGQRLDRTRITGRMLGLRGSSFARTATVDRDGRFRVVLFGRNGLDRLDHDIRLQTESIPKRTKRFDPILAWPNLHASTSPVQGFSRTWHVVAEGAQPWSVDVGTVRLAPAPLVAEVHVDSSGVDSDAHTHVRLFGGFSGNMPVHSPSFAIDRAGPLRLYSWSVAPGTKLRLISDATDDSTMLWSPRFVVPARVRCAVLPTVDVFFDLLGSEDDAHDAVDVPFRALMLVPLERSAEIDAIVASPLIDLLTPDGRGFGSQVGKPLIWSLGIAPLSRVPPDRYEVVLVHADGSEALFEPPSVERLGTLDLTRESGRSIYVALDRATATARVVPPPTGPLVIEVVATVLPPPEGSDGWEQQQMLVSAEAEDAFAQRDWKSLESRRARCDENRHVRQRLELREVEVGETIEIQLFPRIGERQHSSPVYERPVLDPCASVNVQVAAVGSGVVQVVDLGTIAPRPAPAVATFSIEGGTGQPMDVALRAIVRGSSRGPRHYAWMECEPGRMYTLYSASDERFAPAYFRVRVPGFGLTEDVPFERGAHHRLQIRPLTRVRASLDADAVDTGELTDGDRWTIYFVDWRDHFPHGEGKLISERGSYGDMYPGSREVANDFNLAPRTVLELWRHSAMIADGGRPVATVEVELPTDRAVQLGHWTLRFEPIGTDLELPAAETREH